MSLPLGPRPSSWELVRLAPEAAWERVTYRGQGLLRADGDVEEAGVPRRSTANGVFATKLHWPQYQSITRAGVAVTDFPQPVSWVYVSRRDRVAQAVSLARARQSGEWSATPAQRRRPYEPFFDAEAISRALVDVDAWSRGWDDYYRETGIVPIRVVYEDLAADFAGEMQRLFDELGLGVVADPDPPTRRQADAISAEWIARFRASTSTP